MPAKCVTGRPDFILGQPGQAFPVSSVAAEAGRVSHQAKGSRMFQAARTASAKALKHNFPGIVKDHEGQHVWLQVSKEKTDKVRKVKGCRGLSLWRKLWLLYE